MFSAFNASLYGHAALGLKHSLFAQLSGSLTHHRASSLQAYLSGFLAVRRRKRSSAEFILMSIPPQTDPQLEPHAQQRGNEYSLLTRVRLSRRQ